MKAKQECFLCPQVGSLCVRDQSVPFSTQSVDAAGNVNDGMILTSSSAAAINTVCQQSSSGCS